MTERESNEKPLYFSPLEFMVRYGVNAETIAYLVEAWGLPITTLPDGTDVIYVADWEAWKKDNPELYRRFKGPYETYNGTWLDNVL